MKKVIVNGLWIFLFLSISFFSCDKMNDLHDKYLDRGEITYLTKLSGIEIFPGDQRAVVHYVNKDPKANTLVIYWRNRSDSATFTIPEDNLGKVQEIELDHLPEDYLTFEFVVQNKSGSIKSLATETSARIYGERYRASLNNRLIDKATYMSEDHQLTVQWGSILEHVANIKVRYNRTDGEQAEMFLPVQQKSIIYLNLFKDSLYYSTGYVPEENAVDTFYSKWAEIPFSEAYIIKGLAFNGAGQYMRIADEGIFNIAAGNALTVSMWVKTSVGNRTMRLLHRRFSRGDVTNGNTGYGIALLNPSRTYTDWYLQPPGGGSSSGNVLPASSTYDADKWFYIAVIFDTGPGKITLYQDGVMLGSRTVSTLTHIESASDMYIGAGRWASAENPVNYFEGEIAHLHFWGKVLTPSEIQEDMTTNVSAEAPGLIAAYDLRNVQEVGGEKIVPDIKGEHPGILHGF